MKTFKDYLAYASLRCAIYPFSLLPYSALHKLGMKMGALAFYLIPRYRKRMLSNLSLASDLSFSNKELIDTAKASFGNLFITCLEYSKLEREKNIQHLVSCENPEEASAILSTGKGIIFLCAHQANWELFFLEGTSRMPGVAIGQPIKNSYLYLWILKIREKFHGKIVPPDQAVKEGLRALKQGKFLGIVGDQGMPASGFSSPFLGREAWTSPLPALLSHKSGSPIITATMLRKNGKYTIHYSDPIWPDPEKKRDEDTKRLMTEALAPLEKSIKEIPSQWLWSHNRWKQQLLGRIKKRYRQDAIAVFLPVDPTQASKFIPHLRTFRELYPRELLAIFSPCSIPETLHIEEHICTSIEEMLITDYRFKLIFNFTGNEEISKHFLKLSALQIADIELLSKESKLSKDAPLSDLLQGAILNAL